MLFRRLLSCSLLLFVLVALTPVAQADSWLPPKPSTSYFSQSQDTQFVVTFSAPKDNPSLCFGILYKKNPDPKGPDWLNVWEKPMADGVPPVVVLVANSGWRVITFDRWYSVGYGENVIVFYDEKGSVLKKYSLESLLTESELSQLPCSVSSRWWRNKVAIDEALGLLNVDISQRQVSPKRVSFRLIDGTILE